jgi:hypothetical protein
MLIDLHVACICGFCVDAAARIEAAEVLGTDEHFTRGPWVRLDEALDVTVEHRVLTPRGPRPAGALRPGDVVTGADGRPRVLRSVRALPSAPPRRGLNVRTARGTFGANGFLLESEAPRDCAAP